jgi:peroxiredoxin
VDTVACVAVNDAFVLDAWGKSVGADGKVLLLADGSALFTKARHWAWCVKAWYVKPAICRFDALPQSTLAS